MGSPAEAGAAKKVSNIPSGREAALIKRKKERAVLQSFVHAINEATPIVRALSKDPGVCAEIEKVQCEMGILYGYQTLLTERLAKRFELSKSNKDHRWVIRRLSVAVGEMIADLRGDAISIEMLGDNMEEMITAIERHKNEWNMPGDSSDKEGVAKDVRVNTRLSILQAMRAIRGTVENLPMGHNVDEVSYGVIEMAVNLAWDMANNWKGAISVDDKEVLFQKLVEQVGYATSEAWESAAMHTWGNDDRIISDDIWKDLMGSFRAHVTEFHMGHDVVINVVVSRARKMVSDSVGRVLAEYGDARGKYRRVLENALLAQIAPLAQDAWQNAMDGVWQRVEKMTVEEQRQWEAAEGSDPMDLALFDSAFDDAFRAWYMEKWSSPMSLDLLQEAVKKNVVWLWGTADAVFRSHQKEDNAETKE